jgi:hypothetical protein
MKKNKHIYRFASFNYSKIFISVFVMLAISSLSFAQTSKNLWMAGGNLGFNNVEDRSYFHLYSNGGYFLTDHLGAGLSFNFSGTFSEYSNGYSTTLIPYVRYYLGSGKTQPLFMASAGPVYYWYKGKGDSAYYGESGWEFHWNVGAGVSHFLNRNAAIEGIVGYNGSLSIRFGFQIFLGTGKD